MAPGAADALTARLIAKHGFEAIYMTGAGTTAVRLGMPDDQVALFLPPQATAVVVTHDQSATPPLRFEPGQRVLWLKGRSAEALREVDEMSAQAVAFNHELTLGHALSDAACPVALPSAEASRSPASLRKPV